MIVSQNTAIVLINWLYPGYCDDCGDNYMSDNGGYVEQRWPFTSSDYWSFPAPRLWSI